jgi:hypothetical protein
MWGVGDYMQFEIRFSEASAISQMWKLLAGGIPRSPHVGQGWPIVEPSWSPTGRRRRGKAWPRIFW